MKQEADNDSDETKGDIKKTIRFSRELDLVRANYFTYLPFPGSSSYKELESKGELDNTDWDRLYFMSAPYAPRQMASRELRRYQRLAFLKFYSRPRILWRNLKEIKSPRHFKFLSKRFFHWIIMK